MLEEIRVNFLKHLTVCQNNFRMILKIKLSNFIVAILCYYNLLNIFNSHKKFKNSFLFKRETVRKFRKNINPTSGITAYGAWKIQEPLLKNYYMKK